MYANRPRVSGLAETPEEYEQGKAKIFRGPQEFMFAIAVGAIGGILAQLYAHKILKRQGELK